MASIAADDNSGRASAGSREYGPFWRRLAAPGGARRARRCSTSPSPAALASRARSLARAGPYPRETALTASFLPSSTGPYLVLLIIGFVVGGYGHLARFRWLVVAGILIIVAAAVLFQIALRTLPNPPGF